MGGYLAKSPSPSQTEQPPVKSKSVPTSPKHLTPMQRLTVTKERVTTELESGVRKLEQQTESLTNSIDAKKFLGNNAKTLLQVNHDLEVAEDAVDQVESNGDEALRLYRKAVGEEIRGLIRRLKHARETAERFVEVEVAQT